VAAALATLIIILLLVILPLGIISTVMVREASGIYQRVQAGELDFAAIFQRVFDALPAWVASLLGRFGLTELGMIKERLSAALTNSSRFLASQAFAIGQNALDFPGRFSGDALPALLSAARRRGTGRAHQSLDPVAARTLE
jgi:hypothetical protein